MLNYKASAFLSLILVSSLIISCSTTSQTASDGEETAPETESKYPSWYQTSRSIQSDDSSYYGYATALAGDSTASADKAVQQAKAELKTAISSRLESIRNDAVVELGSESGLDSPRFIIAIRKAESEVPSVAEVEEVSVEEHAETGFRSFAKVAVDKEALIEELDKEFSAYGNAWSAMKGSEAFSKF